jgi:hypothetical protein
MVARRTLLPVRGLLVALASMLYELGCNIENNEEPDHEHEILTDRQ